jgi:hypothetical protein
MPIIINIIVIVMDGTTDTVQIVVPKDGSLTSHVH